MAFKPFSKPPEGLPGLPPLPTLPSNVPKAAQAPEDPLETKYSGTKIHPCGRCAYWTGIPDREDSLGECRRLAPRPIWSLELYALTSSAEDTYSVAWPTTRADEGCGIGESP